MQHVSQKMSECNTYQKLKTNCMLIFIAWFTLENSPITQYTFTHIKNSPITQYTHQHTKSKYETEYLFRFTNIWNWSKNPFDIKERQLGETGYKFRFTSLRHGLCNPFGKTKFWFLFDVQVFGLSDKTSMQIRSMQIRSGNLNEISDSILFLRRGQHVHACHQSYSRVLFFAQNWKWNQEERNGVWV